MERSEAIRRGLPYFESSTPCGACGSLGYQSSATGLCTKCRSATNVRKLARASRSEQIVGGRETPSSRLRRENPDMIIDKDTASSLGLNCYRTGSLCTNGHAGWRSIRTGSCIDCKRQQSKR